MDKPVTKKAFLKNSKRARKWWASMLAKFDGDEEAVRAWARERAAKSSRNQTGIGGFNKMTPAQLQEVSKKGVINRGHQWKKDNVKSGPV